MEFDNSGGSVYHKTQAVYIRTIEGQLTRITGAKHQEIEANWQLIQPQRPGQVIELAPGPRRVSYYEREQRDLVELTVYEMQREGEDDIVGLILKSVPNDLDNPFQDFFVSLLLAQMHLHDGSALQGPNRQSLEENCTDAIVDLFDDYLRHSGTNDEWDQGGRSYFVGRVSFFTSRNAKLEFCLPAFPCKSSNPDKVMGTLPDRGEEMALLRLHSFVREIEAIYSPGAKVWIISDGHVFSDCIGVDDDLVDAYTASLVDMNESIACKDGVADRVGFKSLVDLFDLKSLGDTISKLEIPGIDHFLNTKVTNEAELSRQVLMAGCQSAKTNLRRRIDSQEPSILALYRGFSRFMLEDLDLHPYTRPMSRSQRKKLAVKVSFEMIMASAVKLKVGAFTNSRKRNQAYSNLVELLFPDHVRLSIHAHTNSGPKFGVRMFDKQLVKTVRSLEDCTESEGPSCDILHIPTPWHNCMFQFAGSPTIYVAKSKIIKDALKAGLVEGGWVESCPGKGGYFEIRRPRLPSTDRDEAVILEKQTPPKLELITKAPVQMTTQRRGVLRMLFQRVGDWALILLRLGGVGVLGIRGNIYQWTTRWNRARV